MKSLPLNWINYLHSYEGRLYVIYENQLIETNPRKEILSKYSLPFAFKTAPCLNYFQPYGRDNLIFQGSKLFSLKGRQTQIVKEYKQQFKSNICDGIAISGDQFFLLNKDHSITINGQVQCIPTTYLHMFYFNGQIGIELEEETSYYNRSRECLQIENSCIGSMRMCLGTSIIDECLAYYDISSGLLVFPLDDHFDIGQYVSIDKTAKIAVSSAIFQEYNNEDYSGKSFNQMFLLSRPKKEDMK